MNSEIKNKNISHLGILKRISVHVDSKRKKDVKFVFYLSFLSSLSESISIVMLIPFVSFFVNPDNYIFNNLFLIFFDFLNITNKKNILGIVSFSFIVIVLLSSILRLKYIKSSNRLTQNIESDFRIKIFKVLINQDFSYYFKHGSNELMSSLAQKSSSFSNVIFSSISIVNAILTTLAITTILIFNEPIYTPLIIITILIFFFIILKVKSAAFLDKGQAVNLNQNFMIDIFQNTVGYLPEIIVYNLRKFFLTTLSISSKAIAKYNSQIQTISMTPRIYLETFIVSFVILFVYFSDLSERSIEANISYLAILVYGTQKCLPLINSAYALLVSFNFSIPPVDRLLQILEEGKTNKIEDLEIKNLKFENTIKIKNVSFQYNKKGPNILNKINFDIRKGEKVVIKGTTGSGKSTLINIISGLLNPSEGKILVDDTLIGKENLKQWQKNISIVPQTVFLNDATILENIAIALDINSIDIEKVKNCAKIAEINSFVESLPNKYNETVGERGVRLSGGQRQRMGIARALYRNANVIILDEPTNSLDAETEKLVLDSITKLAKDITIIMISHSDNSLKYFDKIIDLNKNK